MKKISWYFGFIFKILGLFFSGNFVFAIKFFWRLHTEIFHKILGIKYKKKLINVSMLGNKMSIYNSLVSYLVMDEIWFKKMYRVFDGCHNILDLGGYLGESAIFFAKKLSANVDVYEADKRNFHILSKNCKHISKINCFEGAVISGNRKLKINYDNIDRGVISSEDGEDLKTYDFFDIINKNKYDGLKIDIEGGEYEILDQLVANNLPIEWKIIFLEFHDIKNKSNLTKILNYISYFTHNGYLFQVVNNDNNQIQLIDIENIDSDFVNIIFKKI